MMISFPYHGYLDDVNEIASNGTGRLYLRLSGENPSSFQSDKSLAGKNVRKNVTTPYVCLEINSSDKLEENIGLLGALFYSCSVLYCMTTSLAHHGEGLGTVGIPESKMRELCAEAGFSQVRHMPMENPFNILYAVTL